jgi:hypothetical protein
MSNQNWQKKWGELVAKSWDDEKLHARLLNDTAAVMKEHGIEIPAGMTVKVVQNAGNVIHLPLPPKPSSDEISEEQLAAVAGGAQTCSVTHFMPAPKGSVVENPALRAVAPATNVVAPATKTTTSR